MEGSGAHSRQREETALERRVRRRANEELHQAWKKKKAQRKRRNRALRQQAFTSSTCVTAASLTIYVHTRTPSYYADSYYGRL